MYEIIYMKADYEPWWMFDGWEEMIRRKKAFSNAVDALQYLEELVAELRSVHDFEVQRKDCFYAFWSEQEQIYCEGCDDDLQLFHGVIVMKDGKPYSVALLNNSNI